MTKWPWEDYKNPVGNPHSTICGLCGKPKATDPSGVLVCLEDDMWDQWPDKGGNTPDPEAVGG